MKSIIQEEKDCCCICGRNGHIDPLDEHHVYTGALRKLSEMYGLKVYLCHDRCHLNGVHKNGKLARMLKAKVQRIAMDYYGWDTAEFIRLFGKNYL